MKEWIKECRLEHGMCSLANLRSCSEDQRLPTLPKRVVALGGSISQPTMRLEETAQRQEQYVTLSYCWGQTPRSYLRLTASNLDELKQHVVFEQLPLTYRDAVTVTLMLGYRYLWIDALCIQQDSAADWEAESLKMDLYYGGSAVTICVDSAESLEAGFLETGLESLFDPLHLQQRLPSGDRGELLVSRPVYTHGGEGYTRSSSSSTSLWRVNVEACPLATRAWALQERLLSPRKLHFGREEVFWECRKSRYAEGGEFSLGSVPSLFKIAVAQVDGNLTYRHWYDLVEAYTTRSLTYQSDKLRAIAGLAKVCKGVLHAEYRAGLWLSDLHHSLNWRVPVDQRRAGINRSYFPSWSWANVQSAVTFADWTYSPQGPTKSGPGFQLISTSLVSGLDSYSGAVGMRLVLRARTRRVVLKSSSPRHLFAFSTPGQSVQAASNGSIGDYADDLSMPRDGNDFLSLQLFDVQPSAGPSLPVMQNVLLLEPVLKNEEQDGCFCRVGAGAIYQDNWFDGCDEQLITLV